jgi:hypothetical protein
LLQVVVLVVLMVVVVVLVVIARQRSALHQVARTRLRSARAVLVVLVATKAPRAMTAFLQLSHQLVAVKAAR